MKTCKKPNHFVHVVETKRRMKMRQTKIVGVGNGLIENIVWHGKSKTITEGQRHQQNSKQ